MKRLQDPFLKALDHAYRLLAIRSRSEREIRRRLRGKRHTKACVDQALSLLIEKGLVNDEKFAREWVRDRMRFAPKGAMAIKEELQNRGIDEDIVKTTLEDPELAYDEYALVEEIADKRLKLMEGANRISKKKKIYDFLARRGFSFDVINDYIDKI